MRRLAAGDSAGRGRQASQGVELAAGEEEAEGGDDGVSAVDGAAVAPAHVRAGVSNYEGTARLKITTPTRPAFLPPPPSNEPEADEVAGRAPHVRRKGRVSGVTDTVSVTVDAYYSTY